MSRKTILVLGATGKQGGSLVAALRPADPSSAAEFRLLALTRTPASPAAQRLAAEPHVQVVQGNLDAPDTMRKVFDDAGGKGSVWGVFVALAFPGLGVSTEGEERQGILIADLSLEYGVSAFIVSTAERGGESHDEQLAASPRAAKVKIERHVRSLGEKGLRWTILRPSFFMENFDGTIGSVTATVLRCGLKPTTKLQLIAAEDIGRVAAAVFRNPDANVSKILVLTGDMLTTSEQDAAYKRATGKHLPSMPNFLGKALLAINGATKNLIADIERVHRVRLDDPAGYDTHLADARAVYPDFMTFEAWAKTRGRSDERDRNWNQVSIVKLMTGRH